MRANPQEEHVEHEVKGQRSEEEERCYCSPWLSTATVSDTMPRHEQMTHLKVHESRIPAKEQLIWRDKMALL